MQRSKFSREYKLEAAKLVRERAVGVQSVDLLMALVDCQLSLSYCPPADS
jgi:transposase-like protein